MWFRYELYGINYILGHKQLAILNAISHNNDTADAFTSKELEKLKEKNLLDDDIKLTKEARLLLNMSPEEEFLTFGKMRGWSLTEEAKERKKRDQSPCGCDCNKCKTTCKLKSPLPKQILKLIHDYQENDLIIDSLDWETQSNSIIDESLPDLGELT